MKKLLLITVLLMSALCYGQFVKAQLSNKSLQQVKAEITKALTSVKTSIIDSAAKMRGEVIAATATTLVNAKAYTETEVSEVFTSATLQNLINNSIAAYLKQYGYSPDKKITFDAKYFTVTQVGDSINITRKP